MESGWIDISRHYIRRDNVLKNDDGVDSRKGGNYLVCTDVSDTVCKPSYPPTSRYSA